MEGTATQRIDLTIPRSPSVEDAPKRTFIPELHGLRGLALLMVVLFHLFGNGRVSGGIDIFLVISGFLFTASLSRQAIATGRIALARHFGRVGFRLLPAALVVLVVVGVATALLLPWHRWPSISAQLLASALFYENWQLIETELGYEAAGVMASPLQHFWSLSIQAQFYLVWPFLILAVVWIARRLRRSPLNALLAVTAVMTAASLAFATWLGAVNQDVAYLHTATRWWELGAGALLGLVLGRLPQPASIKRAAGWVGLALVVTSGLVWDGALAFPGPAALWPVAGALLVLYGSGAGGERTAEVVLSSRPLHLVAELSYPLYLWHWPVAVFYLAARDYPRLGPAGAVVVLLVSVALAWVTQRLVADPAMALVNRIGPRAAARTVAVTLLTAGTALFGVVALLEARTEAALKAASISSPEHPGASILDPGYDGPIVFTEPPVPDPAVATRDRPEQNSQGCIQRFRDAAEYTDVLVCEPVGTLNPPKRTIVVTGGSHSIQWMPALERIGKAIDWEFIVVDKARCPFLGANVLDTPDEFANAACLVWNERAEGIIHGLDPDAVFVLGTRTQVGRAEYVHQPSVRAWQKLAEAGIGVLAIRDVPRFSHDVPECVASAADPATCGIRREESLLDENPLLSQPGLPDRFAALDLTAGICPDDACEPVIGNVLVYRDDDHLTGSYARSLAPALLRGLQEQAPWLFED